MRTTAWWRQAALIVAGVGLVTTGCGGSMSGDSRMSHEKMSGGATMPGDTMMPGDKATGEDTMMKKDGASMEMK
jgi:hypothetical protein